MDRPESARAAWHYLRARRRYYRRLCLKQLKKSVEAELATVAQMAGPNPKNYQVWYHRRALAEEGQDAAVSMKKELEYVAAVLREDGKNYHAWSHRQWAVQVCEDWDKELAFVEEHIGKDVRNNSAWNHRWFVLTQAGKVDPSMTLVLRELSFVATSTSGPVQQNEAAWNYLGGLLRRAAKMLCCDAHISSELAESVDKAATDAVNKASVLASSSCSTKTKSTNAHCILAASLHCIRFRIQVKLGGQQALSKHLVDWESACTELAQLDPVRSKYWQWMSSVPPSSIVASAA